MNKQFPKRGEIKAWLDAATLVDSQSCVLWPYARNSAGYGHFVRSARHILAHRDICERVHGVSPEDKPVARHLCGNGAQGCVNWRHLKWGSVKENIEDTFAFGRGPRGERQGGSKLKEHEVLEILNSTESNAELSRRYGVVASNIRHIKLRKTWRHVA